MSTSHRRRGPEFLVELYYAWDGPFVKVYPTRADRPWTPRWSRGTCGRDLSGWGRTTVTTTVPRRCLGNPRWIRVATEAMDDELSGTDWAGGRCHFTRELRRG